MSHFQQAVVNRLPEVAAKLSSFSFTAEGEWGVIGASRVVTDHSVFGPDRTYKQAYFTNVPTGATAMDIYLYALDLNPEDDGQFMEVSFYAKMVVGGTIEVVLQDTTTTSIAEVTTTFTVPATSPSPNATGLSDTSWRAYRSNPIRVSKGTLAAPRLDILIRFTPTIAGTDVYFANPSVIGMMDHSYYSEAVRNIIPNLPEALFSGFAESNPSAALTRFTDVMYSGLDVAAKALRDYRYFTIEDGRDENDDATLSNLVWPSNTDFVEARWLTQFAGTHPISKLSSVLDPSDPFILDSSQLNGDDTLRFSSTSTLDPPEATVDVVTEFLQWQAQYGYYGMNAGTTKAIEESVKRIMVGAKQVTITLQNEGPFTMLVETPWEQTYGGASELVGQSSVIAKEAISYAKPIGVKVTHRLT